MTYFRTQDISLFKDLEDVAVVMRDVSSPSTTFKDVLESMLIDDLSDLEKVKPFRRQAIITQFFTPKISHADQKIIGTPKR